MKNRASVFLKQVISLITSLIKSKSMAIKTKTSAIKTRIIIYSLLKNKKVLMSSISHKFNSLLAQLDKQSEAHDKEHHIDQNNQSIILYKAMTRNASLCELAEEEDCDHNYPDLTHSLFENSSYEEEDDLDDGGGNDETGSVIDLVRNSKEEEGESFRLEDEIDHVADLFIKKIHRQMRMQKRAGIVQEVSRDAPEKCLINTYMRMAHSDACMTTVR